MLNSSSLLLYPLRRPATCALATRWGILSPSPTSLFTFSNFSTTTNTSSSSSTTAECLQRFQQPFDSFVDRHLGPQSRFPAVDKDVEEMLDVLGVESVDELINQTIPTSLRLREGDRGNDMPSLPLIGASEGDLLLELKETMSQNKIYRSHIGCGYYGTVLPSVIQRCILENPLWYTPYTPYQAEISQGRLEMLLNFQTIISDLVGLPLSNCSLLDEGTSAAEAMNMCYRAATTKKNQKERNVFLVSSECHKQTIDVLKTRADHLGIEIKVVESSNLTKVPELAEKKVCGVLVQYPASSGSVRNHAKLASECHAADALVVVATDLLACTLLHSPGDFGADIALGSAQRFGLPMGYGGPHPGFLACTEALKRYLPGRIIGVTRDSRGKPALRMAMQTREQHIRREKATSNICTSQALMANLAAAYAIYHGPEGLKDIAKRVHHFAVTCAEGLRAMRDTEEGGGKYSLASDSFFDTIRIDFNNGGDTTSDNKTESADLIIKAAAERGINLHRIGTDSVSISFDETTTMSHINDIFEIFAQVFKKGEDKSSIPTAESLVPLIDSSFPPPMQRSSPYLTHPVFHNYHCETELMRYLYRLASKDLSLATAMIPLGSCTMKLNAAAEIMPITWPEVSSLHPFAPSDQTDGYSKMLKQLSDYFCDITMLDDISFQPNAGSQGEYAGLCVIRAYHESRNEGDRNACLIPKSAHGTNPASAALAGLKIVTINCDSHGEIDLQDLENKCEKYASSLSCFMVTYPSTHGVFEEGIQQACETVHKAGGQVYMDGANLNAQVGLMAPGNIGADVCHMNLHKTFAMPHGGGGPGMGPICVAKHLSPFLPEDASHKSDQAIGSLASAPFSSASILPISWMYLRLLGRDGLEKSTKYAILNANYMAAKLMNHFPVLYGGKKGRVAHEFILDLRPLKSSTKIVEEDVAKRLMDFNFHAPTISFPVPGTLMVEPTESESKHELDRFCDALITIREEIRDIEDGKVSQDFNVLKGAPHTADVVSDDVWEHPYSRSQAAYPQEYLHKEKFWPTAGRVDNVFGDRHLVSNRPTEIELEDMQKAPEWSK